MDAPSKAGITKQKINTKDYIVAIGASAGGLEAIHELFDYMPADTNLSFVIVQHLSPDYKSLMPELLAKHTSMEIFLAEDGMLLRENCIYLIPSKKIMTIRNRTLQLTEKIPSHLPNTAIDIFFTSLAQEQGKCAIGIILSGTGTDGTKGIEAIKNAGGIVIVQDPVTAKFDGMPNSAAATGYADLILPPELIAGELHDFLLEAPLLKSFREINQKDAGYLEEVLVLVKNATTYDFSHYKKPTIHRRLAKRMALKNVPDLQEYLQLLHQDPEEVKLLCKEFLIGVTRFFRDEEAFEEFRSLVIPSILANKSKDDVIKAWVVACSTGEEAYTYAILIYEYLQTVNHTDMQVKIFATDIDNDALEIASKGIYPESVIKDVPPEMVDKYFIREGNKYKVSPVIRKMIVFANHDVLKDPPFSKLEFVSCRNMLIYMNNDLQKKVLRTFHFALNPGSYLILGPSENVGVLKDSMEEVSKKWKIFKNLYKARTIDHESFVFPVEIRSIGAPAIRSKNALNSLTEIFRETVTEEYRFAGVYIDKDFEVKQAIGNFKSFLSFPDGKFNFNLLKLVPPDLSIALSGAVRKAIKDNERVSLKRIRITENGHSRFVSIIVKPYLEQSEYIQPFLFIVLNEEPQLVKERPERPFQEGELFNEQYQDLADELKETKENLQAAIEELETANEELQSSNEEMISANEELQSTNEELQSLNEELHTVNAEHQLKIKELIELNDDLNNYFRNSEIGQILVDRNMIIRKFTPATKQIINLIESDIGRSITDISDNLTDINLAADIRQVLRQGRMIEKEVSIREGAHFQMRLSPYIRQNKSLDGVVVTFINITEIRNLNSIIQGIFNSSLNGIVALRAIRDEQKKIIDFEWITSNAATSRLLEIDTSELPGKLMQGLPAFAKHFHQQFSDVVETEHPLHVEYFDEANRHWLEVVAVKMNDGLVVTFTDISDKKKAADLLAQGFQDLQSTTNKLTATNYALEQSNYELLQFASVVSHDLKEPLRKIQTFGNLLNVKIQKKLEQDERSYLEKMINSSQRMQSLIDDLLAFSKLSNKHIHFTETDMNLVLTRILDDLEVTIREKGATFDINPLPSIEAIPGQIHQLFQNLISNALKFNDSGNPYIKVETNEISDQQAAEFRINPEDYISFSIQDNGIGFDPKYKDKIFGVFQRLHSSASYQGTGIGLAICKKIVENHNGFIFADSELHKGTRFTILFPVKQPSAA